MDRIPSPVAFTPTSVTALPHCIARMYSHVLLYLLNHRSQDGRDALIPIFRFSFHIQGMNQLLNQTSIRGTISQLLVTLKTQA